MCRRSLITMILYGPNIIDQAERSSKEQAALTIAQLVQFNTYQRRRQGEVKRERRNKSRESLLPIYVGVSVHAKTRSRDVVDRLHRLGISISYDRVLSISTDLGNEVCRCYREERSVCPSNLRLGLFTTAAVDNIDHNPSSTTAKDHFTALVYLYFSTHPRIILVRNGHLSIYHKIPVNQSRNFQHPTQTSSLCQRQGVRLRFQPLSRR